MRVVKEDLIEGMITIEEFSNNEGVAVKEIIKMIRDGFYEGRVVEDQWYIRIAERRRIENKPSKKASVSFLFRIPIALVLSICIGFLFSFFKSHDISLFEGARGIAAFYYFIIMTPIAFVVIVFTSSWRFYLVYSLLVAFSLMYFFYMF